MSLHWAIKSSTARLFPEKKKDHNHFSCAFGGFTEINKKIHRWHFKLHSTDTGNLSFKNKTKPKRGITGFLYQNTVIPLINCHIKELFFPVSNGTDMTLLLHSKDLTVSFPYHSFVFMFHQETGRKS